MRRKRSQSLNERQSHSERETRREDERKNPHLKRNWRSIQRKRMALNTRTSLQDDRSDSQLFELRRR